MYARLKPFRCQHPLRRGPGAFDSCDYLLTRGYPDQFLQDQSLQRSMTSATAAGAGRQQQAETITRDELITALTEAQQRKVE